MPTINSQIKGSATVTRNLTTGGNANIKGNILVEGNLRIDGYLDSQHTKTPCKGLFADADTLTSSYPHPRPGWWALVGDTLPAEIYRCDGCHWIATGETGGDTSVDLNYYDSRLEALRDSLAETKDDVLTVEASILSVEEDIKNIEHPVSVVDTNDADLIIADGTGAAIATFASGHIRTARFDSATISDRISQEVSAAITGTVADIVTEISTSSNKPMSGLKLSILGDSISTYQGCMPSGYATFYPNSTIDSMSKTWWNQVIGSTGMSMLRLCAWSGSTVCGDSTSTTSAYAGCSTRRISDLAIGSVTPDIVIIWIGINDWGDRDAAIGTFTDKTEMPTEGTINTFSEAYALTVKKVQSTYPRARIYCCTLLEVYQFYNNIPDKVYPRLSPRGTTIIDYNDAIKNICRITGAQLIDIHSCGINYWNHAEYLIDGLHPNAAGAALIANYISKTLNNH